MSIKLINNILEKKDCQKEYTLRKSFTPESPKVESYEEVAIYVKPNFIQKEQTSIAS